MTSSDLSFSPKSDWPKILGQAIFYSSIQASIGSVEMSSKFSVMNFSKDQETLQNAADALRSYLYIAALWALATVLVLWSQYGLRGAIAGLLANLGYIVWIYTSYIHSFKVAAEKYGLIPPYVFFSDKPKEVLQKK
jgi:fatty acid desaturase